MGILSAIFTNIWTFLGTFAALYFLSNAFYQLFLSPLRHIPGPWYAAVSEAWLTSHVFRLRQCRAVQSLFEVYGPIVRIAPNKVAYRDAATNKRIYNNSKFSKSIFYKALLTNDNDHAMSLLPHAQHAVRRKSFAPHYTPSNVALFQPEMHDYTLEVVEILEQSKEAVDVLHLFREMLVDIICEASFNYKVGALKARTRDHRQHYLVRAIDDFPKVGVLRGLFPVWAWDHIRNIPNDRWKAFCDADGMLARFIGDRVHEKRAEMKDGKLDEMERKPLIQRLLEYRLPSGELMPEKDVVSEHEGHFIAGVDTTSTGLSFTLWELSRRPDIAKKLHAELDSAMPDRKTIPDITVLEKLPYLSAVLKETLRVYGPGPSLLERVVPETEPSFDILGCHIPPGTIVATQSWSLHRDAAVFPSPETYLPERWLDADEAQLADMNAHWMPFGSGIRICGGMAFAYQDLRIALATFARNFDVTAPLDETNDRTMEVRDAFVSFPAAMRCKLRFHTRVQ
ncbi:cytochrome P450 [Peniophora sp. CONT]|nr:cytochrome P450 [Peniophora sp. CONT]